MLIYMAGCESTDTQDVVREGFISHGFFSYYYMRSGEVKLAWFKSAREHVKDIIVDSGAHTFFSEMSQTGLSVSVHRKVTKTLDTPEAYFAKYLQWLLANYEFYDYFVELDIGEITGQKQVLEWREILKTNGLFKKCITVYHPETCTFDEYIEMLKDSESHYVALEGDRPRRKRLDYLRLIKPAYERGIKVHGFAMTKNDVFTTYPFYSVDSTSWKAGMQYGSAKFITGTGIKIKRYANRTSAFKIHGMNTDFFSKDKRVARFNMQKATLRAFSKIEDDTTRLWEKRGIIWEK